MKAALLKFWTRAVDNPKTTISGLLSAFAVIALAVRPYVTNAHILTGIAVIVAVAKAITGLAQQDAGTQLAILPGNPTPQSVPSHETPDDPAAVPVKETK